MTRRQLGEKALIAKQCSWIASLRQHQGAEVVGVLQTDLAGAEGVEAFLQQSQEGVEEAAEAELPNPWHPAAAAEVVEVVEAAECLPHHLEEVAGVGEGEEGEVQARIQVSLRAFQSHPRA